MVKQPFVTRKRKPIPYEFVLDALFPLPVRTRPMFGCVAVYVEEKMVLILRDKDGETADNGVWLATKTENHDSLRLEFPNMRPIQVLDGKIRAWQLLPADAADFEEAALRACELILAKDPRIGKIPNQKAAKKKTKLSFSNK